MSLKYQAIRAVFEALWVSRLPRLLRTLSGSRGVIFTLHRVLPETPPAFSPNAILQIQPEFLNYVIERLRELGLDIVTMDEAMARLASSAKGKQFAVLTFDDAYRDNLTFALPILRRHEAPFTLYVPTALVDGAGEIWWQAIEDIIARQEAIEIGAKGAIEQFDTRTTAEKQQAFDLVYWRMREAQESERLDMLRAFAHAHGYDLEAQCRSLIMGWDELRTFADHPLCTIGAHTVHHYELAKLPVEQARAEMADSVDIIEARLGSRPVHFSYPLGGPLSAGQREFDLAREIGFQTAVTTRPGGLYSRHQHEPHALPRISLNGYFQSRRYVDVFATGSVFSAIGKLTG